MRERGYHRRISRPNNSRKVCNGTIGYLSDHWTSVGGYLVTLVSHRPTCPGIRVDSFGALFQHTEVDMLVASRRSESHKISKKFCQYSSTWLRLADEISTTTWQRGHTYRWNYPATKLCCRSLRRSMHTNHVRQIHIRFGDNVTRNGQTPLHGGINAKKNKLFRPDFTKR